MLLRDLVMAKTCGQPENNALRDLISSCLIGRDSTSRHRQRCYGISLSKSLRAAKKNSFRDLIFSSLIAGFHVPSRIPLLRDLGTQSLRAANKQRVSRPHFQYLDWSKFASRHGQRSYGTSIMQKSAGQPKDKAFLDGFCICPKVRASLQTF
jgi:hypothetical protein